MRIERVVLLAAAIAAAAAKTPTSGLTSSERNGKQIYLRGVNAAGKEITALFGEPPIDVPGPVMLCASCHGNDGRGRPEGGVTPSDITWDVLAKPYAVTNVAGRRRPPYTEETLARSITDGVDPAGHRLHRAMPAYRMPDEDLRDLIAYLKRISTDTDPGITETSITIGTMIPVDARLKGVGTVILEVLSAYFADINTQGGVYSRKLELRVSECGTTAAGSKEKLARFIDDENVFALAGAFIAGADREIGSILRDRELPLIGPATLLPDIESPPNRQVFYLYSGLKHESRALVEFAIHDMNKRGAKSAIVYPDEASLVEIVDAIRDQCQKSGCGPAALVRYPVGRLNASSVAKELASAGIELVFFLGPGREASAVSAAAVQESWKPQILSPGSLAGKEVLEAPASFAGRMFLSFPLIAAGDATAAIADYLAFASRHNIAGARSPAAVTAYAAAKVLVQGLELAGRDVSREKLITALEGLYKFDAGLTPPITYGPNRRIGAAGAHVVEVKDRQLSQAARWIEIQ